MQSKLTEKYTGLIEEACPDGSTRYRVRQRRNKNKRITIPIGPDHSDFREAYLAARNGERFQPETPPPFDDEKELRKQLSAVKTRAIAKGINCNLTFKFLRELLEAQNRLCAVSGLVFNPEIVDKNGKRPFAFSIDRIDNSQGYLKTNVRLVCIIANFAMSDWETHHFTHMCSAVTLKCVPRRIPWDTRD